MIESQSRPKLKLMEGGRSMPVSKMHRILMEAYVSNTRLMGVLAVAAHWSIIPPDADRNDPANWEDLHQFFYIDCEEAGLETYQQIRGGGDDDEVEAERIENALFAGLGGDEMLLEERQLRLLLRKWAQFNTDHDLPLPEGRENYDFLLEPRIEAEDWEMQELMQTVCVRIDSKWQAINYFLMRCFSRDYEGACYLCGSDDVPVDLYGNYVCATFYRNEISKGESTKAGASENESKAANDTATYRCVSLIEMSGSYETVVSLVTLRGFQVVGLQHCDRLPITIREAALILKRDEYFIYYEVLLSDEDLEENIDEFTLGFRTTMTEYRNGRLFMRYRISNDHVDSRVFLLNNDVKGMYFLSNEGQLILCAYSLKDLWELQLTVEKSPLGPYTEKHDSIYRFPAIESSSSAGAGGAKNAGAGGGAALTSSLMLEFMNSDGKRFEDFFRPVTD